MEIYDMAGHLVRRLHQISLAVFAERMAADGFDLTPVQFSALATLDANPGIDQATLAGMIAYDKATLGSVIERLETRGLIVRGISPQDRRARVLQLTGNGRALLKAARPVVEALQPDILAGLDDAERGTLLELLHKATEAGNDLSRAPLRRPEP